MTAWWGTAWEWALIVLQAVVAGAIVAAVVAIALALLMGLITLLQEVFMWTCDRWDGRRVHKGYASPATERNGEDHERE